MGFSSRLLLRNPPSSSVHLLLLPSLLHTPALVCSPPRDNTMTTTLHVLPYMLNVAHAHQRKVLDLHPPPELRKLPWPERCSEVVVAVDGARLGWPCWPPRRSPSLHPLVLLITCFTSSSSSLTGSSLPHLFAIRHNHPFASTNGPGAHLNAVKSPCLSPSSINAESHPRWPL